MKLIREGLRFILAAVLFIPFSIMVLLAYCGMMLMKEILIFLGEWEDV